MENRYDRAAEDVGNIVGLEHVNLRVPDQRLATLFYVTGLGLTRDPYLMTGVTNMWINVGRSQFHLPTGGPQHLRGCVGLVMPDLDGLERRLAGVREALADTSFAYRPKNGQGFVDVTCPWGNRFHVHGAGERFGRVALGMPYVMLDVPPGAADGIARFYAEVFETPAAVEDADGAPAARVAVGAGQDLLFRETADPVPPYDGHHIQIYIADFSGPYDRLNARGLISEESSQYQYRFRDIVDPETGTVLYTIEHEVRAMTHPLFARPLVNRNPDQTNNAFAAGHETRSWSMPYDA
jgi:hypothetical protein